MESAQARAALDAARRAKGRSYVELSRLIGRNQSYIQQYVTRGYPRELDRKDLARIARHLGVSPASIGASEEDTSVVAARPSDAAPDDFVRIASLDSRSAGFGIAFHASWLHELASTEIDRLAMIRVEGDAMMPTLVPGDHLVIDTGDAAAGIRDGLYALRIDGALMVKRLAINPVTRLITVASDNEAYPDWAGCDQAGLDIVGRVVWAGRRFL